jgi:hypothetical protein
MEEKAATKGREYHVVISNAVDILADIRRTIIMVLYPMNRYYVGGVFFSDLLYTKIVVQSI